MVSTPARWPADAAALPSADCRPSRSRGASGPRRSNGEDLLLLRLADLVGGKDVPVGELLELRLDALHLVGGHAGALLLGLQVVVRVAPQRADLNAAFFDFLVQLLDEVLTTLLIQRRDIEPDDRSIVPRRESEVRREDGLLDRLDETSVPRLDHDLARLGRADRGERNERRRRAVRVDLQLLHEARGGAPGADARELVLQGVDRLLHPRFHLREDLFE